MSDINDELKDIPNYLGICDCIDVMAKTSALITLKDMNIILIPTLNALNKPGVPGNLAPLGAIFPRKYVPLFGNLAPSKT